MPIRLVQLSLCVLLLGAPVCTVLATPVVEVTKLANGMQVWVAPDTQQKRVVVIFQAAAGSESDPNRLSGLADLTARMLESSARRDSDPKSKNLHYLVDGDAAWNALTLELDVEPAQLDGALDLFARHVKRPTFDREAFMQLREKWMYDVRARHDLKEALVELVARRVYWTGGYPGQIMSADSLEHVSFEDVQAFQGHYVVAPRSALIVAGNVDRTEVLRLARKYFGDWRTSPRKRPEEQFESPPPEMPPHTVVIATDYALDAAVTAVAPAPAAGDPARIVAEVLSAALRLDSSPLQTTLCDRQDPPCRMASHVESYSPVGRDAVGGALFLTAITPREVSSKATSVLRQHLLDRIETPLSEEELAKAKDALTRGLRDTLSGAVGVARTIATELSFGRRPQDIFAMEAKINEVTSAQIQALAKQYFDADQIFTVVVRSNPDRAEAPDLWVIRKDDLAFDSINLRR